MTLRMMPSSRAEVRVVGQKSGMATLRTALFFTGGDSWPAVDLARVNLALGGGMQPPLVLGTQAGNAMFSTGGLMSWPNSAPAGRSHSPALTPHAPRQASLSPVLPTTATSSRRPPSPLIRTSSSGSAVRSNARRWRSATTGASISAIPPPAWTASGWAMSRSTKTAGRWPPRASPSGCSTRPPRRSACRWEAVAKRSRRSGS